MARSKDKLDQTDAKILNLLQEDARMTIKEIAARLNLSSTPVFERIKRLEKRGIINKYVAILNPQLLGKKLNAFVHLSLLDHSKEAVEAFVRQVVEYDEVMECHHVTGDSDFLLKIIVEDIEKYNQFVLNKLSIVGNIGTVKSSFSLSIRKDTNAIRVDLES
ncbi:MAG: Lrp/AsnC family transcriptional regulator [Bacteroidota bacterium]